LLSYLLGINKADQITQYPLVGHLFENLVVLEALKSRYNQGLDSSLYFYRDSHGKEIDILHVSGRNMTGIEIKSATTFNNSFKKSLINFSEKQSRLENGYVVYNGDGIEFSDGIKAINFRDTNEIFKAN